MARRDGRFKVEVRKRGTGESEVGDGSGEREGSRRVGVG